MASIAFSFDLMMGGANKLKAINNGLFDPKKQYIYRKGLIVEASGEAGGIVYDIPSILINSGNTAKSLMNAVKAARGGKISGKVLNDIVGAAVETTDSSITVSNFYGD